MPKHQNLFSYSCRITLISTISLLWVSELNWISIYSYMKPEKTMASHSSTFAWKIPWMEEPGGLQSMGSLESDTTERLHFHFSLSCIGQGNGNPLQYSCLENPRDRGAWWAAIYGVAQTRLKRLSSSSNFLEDCEKSKILIFSLEITIHSSIPYRYCRR